MKVAIPVDNASLRMSGETALPIYYFDRLRERYVQVWLICHERVRSELVARYGDVALNNIIFIQDSFLQKLCNAIGQHMPVRIRDMVWLQMVRLISQWKMRPIVQQLVKTEGIDIIFEPAPISPKALSCLYDLGAPVVIGPLCGGTDFPPAFRHLEPPMTRWIVKLGRLLSEALNVIVPGKIKAAVLLVANDRTREALPKAKRGKVYQVVESGVDLSLMRPKTWPSPQPNQPTRFVYMARFVDQKGIPFLIEAFKQVATQTNSVLELIGDGELFEATQRQVAALNLQERVNFHGRLPLEVATELVRQCDVYVVPALRDAGGCAMLEAMAIGLPVVATNWAGPGEYANETCGIRVAPTSHQEFVDGLATAMIHLAKSPELRKTMGLASRNCVRTNYYDWDSKVDRILEIFAEVVQDHHPQGSPAIKVEPVCETSRIS